MQRRTPALALAAVLSLGTLAACGSSGGSDSSAGTTAAKADKTTTTTAAPKGPLKILVTNDDGVGAPGINELVTELNTLDDVEITVVGPLANKSGTGGHSTAGELKTEPVTMDNGTKATAVVGFPADSVRYAIDDQGGEFDLVVSGNNLGQNPGPLVDVSGTIGAARAGATRGVPALAISQGLAKTVDYASAGPFILDWIKEHRDDLVAGSADATVTSLNVPSCDEGEVRGLLEVPTATGEVSGALAFQDCTSMTPAADLKNDVDAFKNGFATMDVVPNKPAAGN